MHHYKRFQVCDAADHGPVIDAPRLADFWADAARSPRPAPSALAGTCLMNVEARDEKHPIALKTWVLRQWTSAPWIVECHRDLALRNVFAARDGFPCQSTNDRKPSAGSR